METIGQRIRRLRLAKGMASKDLAAAAGLAASTLTELERGASKSTTKLHRIAIALDVSVDELDPPKARRRHPFVQKSGEKISRADSPLLRLADSKLREGFVIVSNFFEVHGGDPDESEDLDLIGKGYEWAITGNTDLLTEINAEIGRRVRKRGVVDEGSKGEVG